MTLDSAETPLCYKTPFSWLVPITPLASTCTCGEGLSCGFCLLSLPLENTQIDNYTSVCIIPLHGWMGVGALGVQG